MTRKIKEDSKPTDKDLSIGEDLIKLMRGLQNIPKEKQDWVNAQASELEMRDIRGDTEGVKKICKFFILLMMAVPAFKSPANEKAFVKFLKDHDIAPEILGPGKVVSETKKKPQGPHL